MRYTIQQALHLSDCERLAGRVPRLALFGPPGSGKTDYLRVLYKALTEKRWAEYADCHRIDLRQYTIDSSDDIFGSINAKLLRAARQLKIRVRKDVTTLAPPLAFESIVSAWLGSSRHLILFIDHLDSAPRHFVNELGPSLKQFFEREDFLPAGGRGRHREHAQLGLVIAGSASLYELREPTKSPIRDCTPIILPQQDMRVCRRVVKERLARVRGWERSQEAITYLAKATGGEPVFLNPLLEKMGGAGPASDDGPVKGRLEQLALGLYGSESYSSTFWHLALHMWLDRELKEKVESLFDYDEDDVRPGVEDIDVDMPHLSGALVVEGGTGRGNYSRYRFRNEIVASFLKDFIENEKAPSPKPHIRLVIRKLRELEQARKNCASSETLWEAVTFLKNAWALVTPYASEDDVALRFYVSGADGAWGWWMDAKNENVTGPEKRAMNAPAEDAVRLAVHNAAKMQDKTPRAARAFVGWNDNYLSLAVIISRTPPVYVVTTLPRRRAGTEFTEYNLNHWVRFLQRKQTKTALINLTLAQLGEEYIKKIREPKAAPAAVAGKTERVYLNDSGVLWAGGTRADFYPGKVRAEDLSFLKSPPRLAAGHETPQQIFADLRDNFTYRLRMSLEKIEGLTPRLDRIGAHDRLVIVSDTEGLKLPLELYPRENSFLGLRLPVARQLYGFDAEPEMCVTFPQLVNRLRENNQPLQVLLVGSNPYRDLRGVSAEVAAVKEIITRGCDSLEIKHSIEVIGPGEATKERIGGYLWTMKSTTHVFHYVGHGGASVGGSEGGLYLESKSEGVDVVGPQELTNMIRSANAKIWFAFVNACAGARYSGGGRDEKGVGEALLDAGVPNFLGYREPVSDVNAKLFAEKFYEKLFYTPRGEPIPELGDAVLFARNAASSKSKHADAWLSSVLLTMGV